MGKLMKYRDGEKEVSVGDIVYFSHPNKNSGEGEYKVTAIGTKKISIVALFGRYNEEFYFTGAHNTKYVSGSLYSSKKEFDRAAHREHLRILFYRNRDEVISKLSDGELENLLIRAGVCIS